MKIEYIGNVYSNVYAMPDDLEGNLAFAKSESLGTEAPVILHTDDKEYTFVEGVLTDVREAYR